MGNLYIVYIATGELYRIATNQLLKGDFDADGDVDNADYSKWRASFGSTNPSPASDGNGNSTFDAADYVAWRKNFGASVTGAGDGAGVFATVPEPMTTILVLQLATMCVLLIRRRQLVR